MSHLIKTFTLLWMLYLAPVLALAQEDCTTIIQAALDATDENCDTTGRNQACYGNITLESDLRSGVSTGDFDEEGERVDLANVNTLTLFPWDESENTWGIALMKLQTSLPDTLPGQNVTFLLFGNVQIENGVETNTEPIRFEITAQSNINVRSGPSADDERIGGLADGDIVTTVGRNANNSWLQIELTDGNVGWVSADLFETDGEISLLNVVDLAEPVSALTPMQVFYFQTGIADAPCAEAPDSGILVQTPEGVGQIEFIVNEVNIRLGSTMYLQAQPGGDMTISVVEGQAQVTASGATVFAPEGTRVRVPLNNNRQASGPPVGPEPYGDLTALPVGHLDQEIIVVPSVTEAEIEEVRGELLPLSGTWTVVSDTCYPELNNGRVLDVTVTRVEDGFLWRAGEPNSFTITDNSEPFIRVEAGVYRSESLVVLGTWVQIRALSPDRLEWETNVAPEPLTSCVMEIEFMSASS